jgi:hypothetical protein
MGLYVYICADLQCLNCKSTNAACVQTKILQVNYANSARDYFAGDKVFIDGLADFCPIFPWRKGDLLCVVIGEWSCKKCGVPYQWAVVSFELIGEPDSSDGFPAVIKSVDSFVPDTLDSFKNVHYVQNILAEFVNYPRVTSFAATIDYFRELPIEEKIDQIISGHRRWLHDVIPK